MIFVRSAYTIWCYNLLVILNPLKKIVVNNLYFGGPFFASILVGNGDPTLPSKRNDHDLYGLLDFRVKRQWNEELYKEFYIKEIIASDPRDTSDSIR